MTSPTVNADDEVTKDVDFYNIFDGTRGRTDSTYLDMEERVQQEKHRANIEGREPDLSDIGALPATCGTPVVTKGQLVDNSYYSNPSVVFTDPDQESDPVSTVSVTYGGKAPDDSEPGVVANPAPATTAPAKTTTTPTKSTSSSTTTS